MLCLRHKNQDTVLQRRFSGFTFVEILVALCIVLIALVPLIRLHVVGIRQRGVATRMARAALLADAKLSEAAAQAVCESGRLQGRVDDADLQTVFHWVLTVRDARIAELEGIELSGVRQIHVGVTWRDGQQDRRVSLETCVQVGAHHESRGPDAEAENDDE